MLKAILRNGAIVPIEPLPTEWQEGTSLEVAKVDPSCTDIDTWSKLMEELCADSTIEEEAHMHAAIDEHRRLAKAQMRREMGLPE